MFKKRKEYLRRATYRVIYSWVSLACEKLPRSEDSLEDADLRQVEEREQTTKLVHVPARGEQILQEAEIPDDGIVFVLEVSSLSMNGN
jgi:hypothetical protein